MRYPPKWQELCEQGTKEGEEEQAFFIAISRHPRHTWLTTTILARTSKLSLERVDEILEKYEKIKVVINDPNHEDQWAYWENVKELLKEEVSLLEEDRRRRMEKLKRDKR